MSEKRFELDRIGIFDNKTNCFFFKTFDNEEVVDLLNGLSDENGKLKEENEQLQKVCSYLKKENQSLLGNIFDIFEKVNWVSR